MTQATAFHLKEPLPKYQGREALVRNLIDHITTGGFSVGSKFLSDNDIVVKTGRSRTAVRQALNVLQDQGWIDRVGGKGTFVGTKLSEYLSGEYTEPSVPLQKTSAMLRVAVAFTRLKEMPNDGIAHRHADRYTFACGASSPRSRKADAMFQQFQTIRVSPAQLSRYPRRVSRREIAVWSGRRPSPTGRWMGSRSNGFPSSVRGANKPL